VARITIRTWTPDQITKLTTLAASGASVIRISAAVNKAPSSIRQKAKELGLEVRTLREIRAKMRDAEREIRK